MLIVHEIRWRDLPDLRRMVEAELHLAYERDRLDELMMLTKHHDLAELDRAYREARRCLMIASEGSEAELGPLGFADIRLLGTEANLEGMYVADRARRQGLGTSLLEGVTSWASSRGTRDFSAGVPSSNAAAIELLLSQGFVVSEPFERRGHQWLRLERDLVDPRPPLADLVV